MQFCLNVYRQFSQLASFSGRTVWHEMYQNGKDEALMLAFKSMNIAPKDGIYIGDAPSDWNLWEKICNIGITSCYTGLEQPISLGGFRLMKNIVHCISVS